MEVGARPATERELGDLADLAALAVDELRPHRGGEVWWRTVAPAADRAWADLLGDPAACVLAGTIDGAPVGYALVTAEASVRGGSLGMLRELYVHPEAREVGVGEALLDAVIAWARERGCYGLDSVVLPGDRAAKNFFESAAMTARAITVHRAL